MGNIYEEYALLEAKKKEIDTKQKQIKSAILDKMNEDGEIKVDTGIGSFSISKRKTWTYPEYIDLLTIDLKAAKAKAESTEEATYTEKDSLRFVSVKL